MDPESKKLLEETYKFAEENNRMLYKIRGVQKWAAFWFWVKTLVIIGIILGSLRFIQPYVEKVLNIYSSISGISDQFKK